MGGATSRLDFEPAASTIEPTRRRARILVVDDDERNLFASQEILRDVGDVVTARSGEEALKRLLQDEFAVILLDVLMPRMDGYETASMIRSRERSRFIPIIFLTAINKEDAHMLRGYEMGAVDYVFKPIDPLILKSKVTVFVELFNKTQEVRQKAAHEQKLLEENLRIRTEKLEAERALRRSEERQAVIIKSLPIALYASALEGGSRVPQFITDNVRAICGFPAEAFVRAPALWADRIHPDDRERVLQEFRRIESAGSVAIEYRWKCADESYRYVLDQAVLVWDGQGAPKEVFGTWLDVSDRRQLEQQLVHAQKMDAIGRLTGGVAHDFNNMLTVVIGSLDRTRRLLRDDPKALKRVELALDGALRCSDLTRRLLAFARRQSLQPQAIDLRRLVGSVTDMVRRILGESVELAIDCGEDLWMARADPIQVESALLNLVVNARDAMPGGGRLTVAARNVAAHEMHALRQAGVADGEYVALAVTDTGAGIPAELHHRVFEPFFTTKEVGEGTGLGLSIIYGFAKQSGGHVTLDSEIGRGTTITIFLPRAPESEAVAPVLGDDDIGVPSARDGELILVVEDDEAVRQTAVGALTELGYGVIEAENGPAALDALEHSDGVRLLFTDLAMPGGLNGRELAAEAIRRSPGLKVLLTSAYTDELFSGVVAGVDLHRLPKPYRDGDLARAVRRALDGV